jgi:hypothetical protein
MLRIKKVTAQPDYTLQIEFIDGVRGSVDVSHLVGKGIFAPWKDPNFFANVFVGESGEPRWNEEIDLDPDSLYMKITGKTPEEVFPALKSETANA